jgi:TorA maturation chaperone TorD
MKAPSLLADFQNADGGVRWPTHWKELAPMTRADLLQDWIGILTEEYRATWSELFEAKQSSPPVNGG